MVSLFEKGGKQKLMINKLNQAIDYIEENLADKSVVKDAAFHTGITEYHLRKTFFLITGLTLNEYIKSRRLSEANKDLLQGQAVTDVAFKYGYESLDGFTRAFKKWNGFLPSVVKTNGISKYFPKMSFALNIKGGISMEYRIENKPGFYLAGKSKKVPMQFEGVNEEIVQLTESITPEQEKEMHELQNMAPFEIVNASYDADENFLKEEDKLMHLVGVLTTQENISSQLDKIWVPATIWAVFPNTGPFPETLQDTWAKTYAEWLVSSDYELVAAPNFSFTKMDENKDNYAYSEIWLPVRKITK